MVLRPGQRRSCAGAQTHSTAGVYRRSSASLHKACDKCGGWASDTMPASLRHGASQQTALLRPRCTSGERSQPKFIVVLYGLQCRSHYRPGSDLRGGQARHGYEWSQTTSITWTSASIPPGKRQPTERNGVASWAQQWERREMPQYRDNAGDIVQENCSISSLIWMRYFESVGKLKLNSINL